MTPPYPLKRAISSWMILHDIPPCSETPIYPLVIQHSFDHEWTWPFCRSSSLKMFDTFEPWCFFIRSRPIYLDPSVTIFPDEMLAYFPHPWLVGGLEHALYFPIYWECHHPNWRTLIFFRWVGVQTTNQIHRLSIY